MTDKDPAKEAARYVAEASHLADLIVDLVYLHTEEDTSLQFILTALSLAQDDIEVDFKRGETTK